MNLSRERIDSIRGKAQHEALLAPGEVADLIGHNDHLTNLCEARGRLLISAEAEIDRLKAENEALRKDAERYQWLRQGMGKVIVVEPDNDAPCDCDGYEVLLESEVDDAVDADIDKEAIHD